MRPTIRIVAITFYLSPRDGEPLAIFTTAGVPLVAAVASDGRVAVNLIATRLVGVVGHIPSRVEVVNRWRHTVVMVNVLCLRFAPEHQREGNGKYD